MPKFDNGNSAIQSIYPIPQVIISIINEAVEFSKNQN